MQHVTIEEILDSDPETIRNTLQEVDIETSLYHVNNIKKLLLLYSKFNMLSSSEKKLVNKFITSLPIQFYKEMELYVNTGKIINELNLLKHIQDFIAVPIYRIVTNNDYYDNNYIEIYDNKTGKLLQKIIESYDPHQCCGETFENFFTSKDEYLYVYVFGTDNFKYELRQYYNEGTDEEPNFVFTNKSYKDPVMKHDVSLVSITINDKYLVLKYDNGIINYVDPFDMVLINL